MAGSESDTGTRRTLVAQPLASAAFAPFGDVLQVPDGTGLPINAGSAQRHDQPPPDVTGDSGAPCLTIFRTHGPAHAAPWTLHTLERHALGSQTFVPLGTATCLAVVAPTLPDGGPDTDALQAFLVGPGQGVTLRRGTWHHPLLTLGAADVLVLERRGATVDCEVMALTTRILVTPPSLLHAMTSQAGNPGSETT